MTGIPSHKDEAWRYSDVEAVAALGEPQLVDDDDAPGVGVRGAEGGLAAGG